MTTPDSKPKEDAGQFLSRWSQRKQLARDQEKALPAEAPKPAAETPLPQLPPVEQLNMDSDYRGFLHPKVDEALRRTALKKLFSDPHFNIMDGLDTYIDDYSISDPIPAAMLAEMKSAQDILGWAKETEKEAELRRNPPAVEAERIADHSGAAETLPAAVAAAPDIAATDTAASVPQKPDDGAQSA
jgi:hypothetical protein